MPAKGQTSSTATKRSKQQRAYNSKPPELNSFAKPGYKDFKSSAFRP